MLVVAVVVAGVVGGCWLRLAIEQRQAGAKVAGFIFQFSDASNHCVL